ncbi:MAG: NAD(P)-dependent oxidoreductase [Herminiimonas sp.]|nr:NAD(P)-dependent oxidoreductase [Herminiimonas sp.]
MNFSTSRCNVAFLGIGLMGRPMAIRLLKAGFTVTVWNRTSFKANLLSTYGARVADTPQAAVYDQDIIITMLDSGPIVSQVVTQAMPNLAAGCLFIDMSSTRQSEAQVLHDTLHEIGVGFIDAPVSGGVIGAESGGLAIMAGGSQVNFDRAYRVLAAMGRPTLVGGAGCGQLAKLCNQLIVGGTLNIVAEALLLAQAGGADPNAVRNAIRGGFAESRILEVHGQRMLDRNFLPGGQIRSQAKDLDNVLIAAATAGLNLPLTEMVTAAYGRLAETVPSADQSAAILELERRNPGHRLGLNTDQLPP